MHKDLSEDTREGVEIAGRTLASAISRSGDSLAIAREAMIEAFDAEAERLDGGKS